MNNKIILPLMISVVVGLSACKNAQIKGEYPKTAYEQRLEKSGSVLTQSKKPFNLLNNNLAFGKGGNKVKSTNVVKDKELLHKAAIETISFMPLVSADLSNGVIITDWHASADAPNERYKFNIFITGDEIDSSSIDIKLYKQERVGNDWQDVSVNTKLIHQIRDNILHKARSKA